MKQRINICGRSKRQLVIVFFIFCISITAVPAQSSWNLTTIDQGGLCGEFPSAAITSEGSFLISTFSNGKLKLTKGENNGGVMAWSNEIVDAASIVGEFSSIALDDNDNPAIAYFDVVNLDLKVAVYDGLQWNIYIVDNDSLSSGRYASIAIGPDGNPAVAYIHIEPDGKTIRLRYAQFDGTNWTKENLPAIKPSNGSALSLKFSQDGHPAIAYSELFPWRIVYLKYNGSTWESTIINDNISGGMHPSLAFDENGFPGIAYHVIKVNNTWSMYDLYYSHFDGATWTSVEVNSGIISSDTGYYPSLKFDFANNPCISYFEWGDATSLQYARFTGTRWIIETPPQQGIIGFYSSLVFDLEGNANVFAFEIENNTLVWAKRTE